ncbi:NAD(P)-binding domain-containing protein [Nonomuraea sp. NPDC046802]|uniref:NAD(P)-binding domain-containing protein n=1 Tax=Nonomuraea sp. NPDC046802 TaxID=3154919 RepID=UPI0034072DB3
MRLAVVGDDALVPALADRLAATGHTVTVFPGPTVSAAPLPLGAATGGAASAGDVAQAVRGAEVVLVCYGSEAAVEEGLFGHVRPALGSGTLLVDASSTSVRYARSTAERLTARGVRRVELCVLGGPHALRTGRARLYAAGDRHAMTRLWDVLASLGETRCLGRSGSARAVGLAFDVLAAVHAEALTEALTLGVRAGVDWAVLAEALTAGRAPAEPFVPSRTPAPRLADALRLALCDAEAAGVSLPVTASTAQRLSAASRTAPLQFQQLQQLQKS